MKHLYETPVAALLSVDATDVLTASIHSASFDIGSENGGDYSTIFKL